ncbi:MAG TPA: hypothetical protein VFJ16_05020 [Longimicrobium sp.]|nr:hypothetical protein [Longimicrobium sp.]
MSHFDPSWCARINAHRRPSEPAADPPAPPPQAQPEAPSGIAAGSPFKVREIPKEHLCEMCGTMMYDHNCKIVCPNCGYKRDCSDP